MSLETTEEKRERIFRRIWKCYCNFCCGLCYYVRSVGYTADDLQSVGTGKEEKLKDVIEEYAGVILAVFFALLFLGLMASMLNPGGEIYQLVQKFFESAGALKK